MWWLTRNLSNGVVGHLLTLSRVQHNWGKNNVVWDCSNEIHFRIVLEDEAQAITTRPCGQCGRHPTDTPRSKSSPPQRTPCTVAGTTAIITALTPSPNLNQWPFTAFMTGLNIQKLQGERSGLWGHQFNTFQQKHSTWSKVHAPQREQTLLCSTMCW